ncbi:sensor histidine kinase [Flavobacterium sp. SM2513]|uniref:sensor histidine kinase n=1 Tax=Flavobacterium sp. SM2513 TaxID=3424766 RepID=UPI003D7FB86E
MLFSFSSDGFITRMNQTMLTELGLDSMEKGKHKLEDFLNVGSKIFFQTHFVPLIKMQGFAREIYLNFKSPNGTDVPVLLNVTMGTNRELGEIHCGGMIISNRNRFEKELLLAKNAAEEALSQNVELLKIRAELELHQRELEMQLRKLSVLNRQHQDILKVIAHDLQEPLRKSVFYADMIKNQNHDLHKDVTDKLDRIIVFNEHMRHMVISLQRLEELENRQLCFQSIELQSLFDDVVSGFGFESDSIKINYQLIHKHLQGDLELLKNLFVELFLNSIRFRNPEKILTSIEISSVLVQRNIYVESAERYLYEDFVKLTFSDDGIGFDTDSSLVFKIFQRGDEFDRISPGLAYCRRIIEMHEGSILAKSIGGKGAGFTIFIPVKQIKG